VQRGKEEKFYRNFFDYTRENYSDIGRLHLMNVREDSPTLSFLKRSASAYRLTAEVPECEVSPRLELPQSYEQYMAALSRKNRHELRRKVKKIESSSGFLTKRIVDPEEVRSHIAEFIALHRGRSAAKDEFWQKKGIEDFFYDLLHVLSLKGWMELRLLYYEKSLAAVLIGFIYEGELSFYNIAFDSRFAAYSPGIYLFDVSIRWAIEQGFRRVDWLRGREKYKYYFGTKECKIKDFILSFRESKK
jgi:CelD/BcsL family acetyltransferase involved in cellulose biosynthesis